MKLPSLTELRLYVLREKLAGYWDRWPRNHGRINEDFFGGNCHYASRALSLFLTGSTRHLVRGWYTDTKALKHDHTWIRNSAGHIGHTWMQFDGKIIDPTWWAFHPGQPIKIYEFAIGDKRYHTRKPI